MEVIMERLEIASAVMSSMLSRGMETPIAASAALAAADALLAADKGPVSTDPSSPTTVVPDEVKSSIDDLASKIQAMLAKLQPASGATPSVRTDVGDITSPQSEFTSVSTASSDNQAAHRQSLKYGGRQQQPRK